MRRRHLSLDRHPIAQMPLRHARHFLLQCASAVGATRYVARSAWRRSRLVILCYHGISLADEHEWNPELYMPAALFRDRMRRLRDDGYNVLPLSGAVDALYAGDLPPRSVAVTFDDGFYDFHARALPVLREFEIPATNFVATFYSLFQRPVFDPAASYLLWKARARRQVALGGVVPEASTLPIDTAQQRLAVWRTLTQHARQAQLSAGEKDALLSALATELGIDYAAWTATRTLQQMRDEELRALPSDLVDIQLHTHRHRMPEDRSLFVREIADNRTSIRDLVASDLPRSHFCYPSGQYHPRAVEWLGELDIQCALTCDPGICTSQDHPLLLPRFTDTSLQPTAVFDGWVSGLYSQLPLRPRLRELRARRCRPSGVPFEAHTGMTPYTSDATGGTARSGAVG
ncbi:MAG: polysaccharide deacetylase family protein [Gemmatirosa sp.]